MNGFMEIGLSGLLSLLLAMTPRLVCLMGSGVEVRIIGSDLPSVCVVRFLAHGILLSSSDLRLRPGVEAEESGVAQL